MAASSRPELKPELEQAIAEALVKNKTDALERAKEFLNFQLEASHTLYNVAHAKADIVDGLVQKQEKLENKHQLDKLIDVAIEDRNGATDNAKISLNEVESALNQYDNALSALKKVEVARAEVNNAQRKIVSDSKHDVVPAAVSTPAAQTALNSANLSDSLLEQELGKISEDHEEKALAFPSIKKLEELHKKSADLKAKLATADEKAAILRSQPTLEATTAAPVAASAAQTNAAATATIKNEERNMSSAREPETIDQSIVNAAKENVQKIANAVAEAKRLSDLSEQHYNEASTMATKEAKTVAASAHLDHASSYGHYVALNKQLKIAKESFKTTTSTNNAKQEFVVPVPETKYAAVRKTALPAVDIDNSVAELKKLNEQIAARGIELQKLKGRAEVTALNEQIAARGIELQKLKEQFAKSSAAAAETPTVAASTSSSAASSAATPVASQTPGASTSTPSSQPGNNNEQKKQPTAEKGDDDEGEEEEDDIGVHTGNEKNFKEIREITVGINQLYKQIRQLEKNQNITSLNSSQPNLSDGQQKLLAEKTALLKKQLQDEIDKLKAQNKDLNEKLSKAMQPTPNNATSPKTEKESDDLNAKIDRFIATRESAGVNFGPDKEGKIVFKAKLRTLCTTNNPEFASIGQDPLLGKAPALRGGKDGSFAIHYKGGFQLSSALEHGLATLKFVKEQRGESTEYLTLNKVPDSWKKTRALGFGWDSSPMLGPDSVSSNFKNKFEKLAIAARNNGFKDINIPPVDQFPSEEHYKAARGIIDKVMNKVEKVEFTQTPSPTPVPPTAPKAETPAGGTPTAPKEGTLPSAPVSDPTKSAALTTGSGKENQSIPGPQNKDGAPQSTESSPGATKVDQSSIQQQDRSPSTARSFKR